MGRIGKSRRRRSTAVAGLVLFVDALLLLSLVFALAAAVSNISLALMRNARSLRADAGAEDADAEDDPERDSAPTKGAHARWQAGYTPRRD